MRRLPPNQPNFFIHRERNVGAQWRLVLLLFCGLGLAGGFVLAAGRRFAALQVGYRSEELRRERTRLFEEQRRLLLAREEAATPARLEGAARGLGMQPARPAQIGTAKSGDRTVNYPVPALINPSASLHH